VPAILFHTGMQEAAGSDVGRETVCTDRVPGSYKLCERLHKFIGKKIKATQKLIPLHFTVEQKKKPLFEFLASKLI
jgi:hypothetical protein